MRKIIVLSVAILFASSMGWTAVTCNPGMYNGQLQSVLIDLNRKEGVLTVEKNGEKCIMNFKTEGASEVWELNGKNLIQKEFDNSGKIVQQYSATLEGDKFVINCKDRTKNECDGGIDSRNYWQLVTTPSEVIYAVYGVSSDYRNDPNAVAMKRHEFTFKRESSKKVK